MMVTDMLRRHGVQPVKGKNSEVKTALHQILGLDVRQTRCSNQRGAHREARIELKSNEILYRLLVQLLPYIIQMFAHAMLA